MLRAEGPSWITFEPKLTIALCRVKFKEVVFILYHFPYLSPEICHVTRKAMRHR